MRLMGARDEGELVQSLKAAVGAILAKAPAVEPLRNDPTSMEEDGLAERMQRGTRVNPRSQLDKELDSIAADMPVEDAEIDNEHEQPGEN